MAISATHYHLLKMLRDRGELPQGGRILEIGKANWYGDMDPDEIRRDHQEAVGARQGFYDGAFAELALTGRTVSDFISGRLHKQSPDQFLTVRLIYDLLMNPSKVTSIDLDPAAVDAVRLDLNDCLCPMDYVGDFDLVINHGTAEHIFNIANVFWVMHEACKAGGLMIHESPFTGWVDHGFYCLQPTLFWDLAEANGYKIVGVWIEHLASRTSVPVLNREHVLAMKAMGALPDNAMLFVVYRKQAEKPFTVPQQHVYAPNATAAAVGAWRELR